MKARVSFFWLAALLTAALGCSAQGGVEKAQAMLRSRSGSKEAMGLAVSIVCSRPQLAQALARESVEESDWARRRTAAAIWRQLGPQFVMAQAVERWKLHEDPNWAVREEVLHGLSGAAPQASVLSVLKKGLADPVWRVRMAALTALGRWPMERRTDVELAFVKAASDRDESVRRVGVRALCKFGTTGIESTAILRDALLNKGLPLSLRRSCWLQLDRWGAQFEIGLESEATFREGLFIRTLALLQVPKSREAAAQLLDLISHPESRQVLGSRIMGRLVTHLAEDPHILAELRLELQSPAERSLLKAVIDAAPVDWPRSALLRDVAERLVLGGDPVEVLLDELSTNAGEGVKNALLHLLLEDRGRDVSVPRWMARAFQIWLGLEQRPHERVLKRLTHHRGRGVRRQVAVARVKRSGPEGCRQVLAELLSRLPDDAPVVAAVAADLSKRPKASYLEFFHALVLKAQSSRARLSGMRGLETLDSEESREIIRELLTTSSHREIRARTLTHLLTIGDPEATDALLRRLRGITGLPTLDDVRLLTLSAPSAELSNEIVKLLESGRFADRSLPGLLQALKPGVSEARFEAVANRVVAKGLGGERPILTGNTVQFLLEKYRLVGVLPDAMAAFEEGRVRMPSSLLGGIVEVSLLNGETDQLKQMLIRSYSSVQSLSDGSERRTAMIRGLVQCGGAEGRALVEQRVASSIARLMRSGPQGPDDLRVADELVEAISALLENGGESGTEAVLNHVAAFVEAHVYSRLSGSFPVDALADTDEQLLQLMLIGLNSEMYPAVEKALDGMMEAHPVVAAFFEHDLLGEWMESLGPGAGQRAPCASMARLSLRRAGSLAQVSNDTQLLFIRSLLDRGTKSAARLAERLITRLERWRLAEPDQELNRDVSFLRMRPTPGVAFDAHPLAVARAIAHMQSGLPVQLSGWKALADHGEWQEMLRVIQGLRTTGALSGARELHTLLIPGFGRRRSVLAENVMLLLAEGQVDAAKSRSRALSQRFSATDPLASAMFKMLHAACEWGGGGRDEALRLLRVADEIHPEGRASLNTVPGLLEHLSGIEKTKWFKNRQ